MRAAAGLQSKHTRQWFACGLAVHIAGNRLGGVAACPAGTAHTHARHGAHALVLCWLAFGLIVQMLLVLLLLGRCHPTRLR